MANDDRAASISVSWGSTSPTLSTDNFALDNENDDGRNLEER